MFVCKQTGEKVEISELENYPFYSPEIDEDLFLFETSPDVSQEAWAEAKGLINAPLPENFSTNKQLEQFMRSAINDHKYDLKAFKALDIHKSNQPWEYDEAVLMALFYYKFVTWY